MHPTLAGLYPFLLGSPARCAFLSYLSWSMLGHVLSKEQSKDGSDGASDDGRLTNVQCHHYHRPPLSDLYWSSVGILPYSNTTNKTCILIIVITNQHHVLSTAAQPEPHHATHIPCARPIISRMHQFSRSWVSDTTRTCEDLCRHPSAPSGVQVSSLYVHSTTICSSS